MTNPNQDFDVIIIGAGPAGISAAIWCKDLGLNAVVLEKEGEPGGQLLHIYNPVTNYPGLRAGSGRELRDRFIETAESFGVRIVLSAEVAAIDAEKATVSTIDGRKYSGRAIVAATGVRRRTLGIPGEIEFGGKGVIGSGARDKELVRGKAAAIIGGGDAALENALILADHAAKVYVVHRRTEFSAREEFLLKARSDPRIEFILDAAVTRICGDDKVESIELVTGSGGATQSLAIEAVLVRIGVEPNTEMLAGTIERDPLGYVCRQGRKPFNNLYVIGDIADPTAPTISNATGMGSRVAKEIVSELGDRA